MPRHGSPDLLQPVKGIVGLFKGLYALGKALYTIGKVFNALITVLLPFIIILKLLGSFLEILEFLGRPWKLLTVWKTASQKEPKNIKTEKKDVKPRNCQVKPTSHQRFKGKDWPTRKHKKKTKLPLGDNYSNNCRYDINKTNVKTSNSRNSKNSNNNNNNKTKKRNTKASNSHNSKNTTTTTTIKYNNNNNTRIKKTNFKTSSSRNSKKSNNNANQAVEGDGDLVRYHKYISTRTQFALERNLPGIFIRNSIEFNLSLYLDSGTVRFEINIKSIKAQDFKVHQHLSSAKFKG